MSTSDTFKWERDVLNDHAAYPGHPIVIACMIMDRYQDRAHATRVEPGDQFPNASADMFIPGAGCAVATAQTVLKLAQEHGVEHAFALATRYWDGYLEQDKVRNRNDYDRGLLQFERIKERFVEHLAVWGTPSAAASRFRLPDEPAARRTANSRFGLGL